MIHGVMPGALLSTLLTLLVLVNPDVLRMFALEKLQSFSTPKIERLCLLRLPYCLLKLIRVLILISWSYQIFFFLSLTLCFELHLKCLINKWLIISNYKVKSVYPLRYVCLYFERISDFTEKKYNQRIIWWRNFNGKIKEYPRTQYQ